MIGFGLYSKLALALVMAVALTGGVWKSYSMGKKTVQAEWNIEKLAFSAATLKATQEAFAETVRLQKGKDDAIHNAKKRETILKADAATARDAATSLQDATASALRLSSESHGSCLISSNAFSVVLNLCTKEYRELGAIADRHANDSETLIQAWPK